MMHIKIGDGNPFYFVLRPGVGSGKRDIVEKAESPCDRLSRVVSGWTDEGKNPSQPSRKESIDAFENAAGRQQRCCVAFGGNGSVQIQEGGGTAGCLFYPLNMKGMMDKFQLLQAGLSGLQWLPAVAGSELLERLLDGNESLGRFGMPCAWIVKEVTIVYKISKPFAQAADLVC
jgi:hypothetical protein